jgi:hypothetical protein
MTLRSGRPCAALAVWFLLLAALPLAAQDAVPTGAEMRVAAANTELLFEMGETVSSKTHQRGDRFVLRLAAPLVVDGQVLVPAGTTAVGEVVHAAKSAMGGQAGELILAARYVDFAGQQIPLRTFRAGVGAGREGQALAVALALGPAGMLVRGRHVEIDAGALISARLKQDTPLPPLAAVPASEPESESATPAEPATAAAETAVHSTHEPGEVSE